jgi:hypothetical protein
MKPNGRAHIALTAEEFGFLVEDTGGGLIKTTECA